MKTELNSKAKNKNQPCTQFYVRMLGGNKNKLDKEILTAFNSVDIAQNEANRLAEQYPNEEFIVLAKLYTVKFAPVYEKTMETFTV